MTYNHSSYILDTLNGFVMQKTDFPFVCTIVDDASTDGEQKIIHDYFKQNFFVEESEIAYHRNTEYAIIDFARHKTNKNCFFAVLYLKENHYQKKKSKTPYLHEWRSVVPYIALCEGDDYWTDPLKLQKQVDFLESHLDVGLCYTDYSECNREGQIVKKSLFEQQKSFRPTCFKEHLLNKCYIAPMTWLFRRSILDEIGNYGAHSDGSFALSLEFFLKSKVYYLPETTAVYRVVAGSAAHQTDPNKNFQYRKGVYQTQWEYAKKYGYSEAELTNLKASQYLSMIPFALDAGLTNYIEEAKIYCESIGFNLREYIAICRNRKQLVDSPAFKLGQILLKPIRAIHLDNIINKYFRKN